MENSQPSGSNVNGNASAPPESYVPSLLSSSFTTTTTHPPTASTSKHSRVTSTVAQSFAADLDSMFGLSPGGGGRGGGGADVDVLSQNVEEKKKDVSTGQSELEQLEARLRETEQRLARVSRQNSPSRQAITGAATSSTNNTNTSASALRGDGEQRQPHPFAQKPTYPADRPPTAPRQDTQDMMRGMPGAMPETPGEGGREDYVVVDDGRGR